MSNTKYMIAEAGSDSKSNKSANNITGEQRGYELRAIWDYDFNWTRVFRANDTTLREQIADFMERAVLNGYVGYSQTKRGGLFTLIKPLDFKVELLNEHAQCDCSSLVYTAIYAATNIRYKDSESDDYIAPVTEYFDEYLNATGKFTEITAEDYLGKTDNLMRGDILLLEYSHVAVFI